MHELIGPWRDIVIALVLAVIFAVIVDAMKVGSGIRAAIRHVRNRLAERSIEKLRKRLDELKKGKARLVECLTSDRALYLYVLQFIAGVLGTLAMSFCCFVISESGIDSWLGFFGPATPGLRFSAIFGSALAAMFAWTTARICREGRGMILEEVSRLDKEIGDLEMKLKKKED